MKNNLILSLLFLGISLDARSQVSITGPTCALPGVVYQYLISTTDTAGAGIHICLSGGVFAGTSDSCLNDSLVSAVYVVWNSSSDNATISFNSNTGSYIDTINLTSALQGGSIDTAYLQQTIGYDSSVSFIPCSVPTGGACSPSYSYQWQRSLDNVNWDDIDNATNQNMDVSIALTQSTFFRRKVTEATSNSVGFSTVASVSVAPQQSTDTTGNLQTSLIKRGTDKSTGIGRYYIADSEHQSFPVKSPVCNVSFLHKQTLHPQL